MTTAKLGSRIVKTLQAMQASILDKGWDADERHLFWHLQQAAKTIRFREGGACATIACVMPALADELGRSVSLWEKEPKRTQEQVLNLIREVIR